MKNRKNIMISLICMLLLVLIIEITLEQTGVLHEFISFLGDYKKYLGSSVDHRIKLFENVVSNLCAGSVTFIALLITILHENKKDRNYWNREREKETEERLWSVRPFLQMEVKSVSVPREGEYDDKDYIMVGEGKKYQYASIVLLNNGYGKCIKITLDGRECSVGHLDVNGKQDLDIYLVGVEDENETTNFNIILCYQDIFGNSYSQTFEGVLNSCSKTLDIELGETLITREEKNNE